ncbi:MAG: hypothetical protein HZC41_25065 [Chloroflexi bacterium]|nr:hypothetical protein [Chloroflexota bacterium]
MDVAAVGAQALAAGAQVLVPLFFAVAGFVGALFGVLHLILFLVDLFD